MNSVTMIGRLTADPDLKHVSERAICRLRLAVDNGRHPTTYIDVDTFEGQAYACAEYLARGRQVGVSGRLAFREWRDAGNRSRQRYFVLGKVQFLDRHWRDPAEEEPIGPPADAPEAAQAEQPEPALAV